MNSDVVLSFVRQALTLGGGFLVTKGYLDGGTLAAGVGAVITLASIGWSFVTHKTPSA